MVVPIAGGAASAAGAGNGLALVAGLLFFRIFLLTVRFRWIYVLPLDGMMLLLGNLFGSSLWLVLFRVWGEGFFVLPLDCWFLPWEIVLCFGGWILFLEYPWCGCLGVSTVFWLSAWLLSSLSKYSSLAMEFFGWVGWNIGFVNALCACLFK